MDATLSEPVMALKNNEHFQYWFNHLFEFFLDNKNLAIVNLWFILAPFFVFLVLRNSRFFKNGFVKLPFIALFCLCFTLSCNSNKLPKEEKSAVMEALYDYHYGIKDLDLNRFRKVIFEPRKQLIPMAMALNYSIVDYDITWIKDSFVAEDTAYAFYTRVDTEWGKTVFKKKFFLCQDRWMCKLKEN